MSKIIVIIQKPIYEFKTYSLQIKYVHFLRKKILKIEISWRGEPSDLLQNKIQILSWNLLIMALYKTNRSDEIISSQQISTVKKEWKREAAS